MKRVSVDFDKKRGRIKPMHATNNGPVCKFGEDPGVSNLDAFREAGIPYARTHDSSFYDIYGGEHTVDVHGIFPDFDADPEDPASYDFVNTDEYFRVIGLAGTKVFYRLGSKIEHYKKKYGTLPPKDFKKWAVICEHIIRHYTEGWAEGFHMDIEYWEIWNEPDLDRDESPNKRCWGGTKQQFFEFYHVAATHLKACFPHLKIGGPALANRLDWARDFLAQLKAPLDFFSWHVYKKEPAEVAERAGIIRRMLDEFGFTRTESILNEWNYVLGWKGDEWLETLIAEKNLKGAGFIMGTMCLCQSAPVDMLMYYDARPGGMNGMFHTDIVSRCLKGYYPFRMFNELYKLKESAAVESEGPLYACAATDGEEAAVVVTNYISDGGAPAEEVELRIRGFAGEGGIRACYYLLDEAHDLALIREEVFRGEEFSAVLSLPRYGSYLVKLSPAGAPPLHPARDSVPGPCPGV